MQGVFLCIASFTLLGLIAWVWLPGNMGSEEQVQAGSQPLSRLITAPIIMLFVAGLLLTTGEAGLWTYWDRVGTSAGIPVEKVGLSLSLSQIGGMLGGFVAALIGTRFGRTIPVTIGLSLIMASLAAVIIVITMLTFTAAAFFFTSAISFVTCYYFGIAAEADPSGRLVVTGNVMFTLGLFAGPGLASMVIGHGYNMLLWIMLGHFLLSLALVLPATRPHRMPSRYDAPVTA
jgi:predicted MFS family arabinose efflux permease